MRGMSAGFQEHEFARICTNGGEGGWNGIIGGNWKPRKTRNARKMVHEWGVHE